MKTDPTIDFAAFRSPVLEKHIDFILEEEFTCSPEFLNRFIAFANAYCVADSGSPNAKVRSPGTSDWRHAARSVTADAGETDVLVIYEDAEGQRVALLIEDKVRAGFQETQADRYRERGKEGVDTGHWHYFWTCLVAPAEYGQGNEGFDARVSVEELATLFPGQDSRSRFRTQVLQGALEHFKSKGVRNPAQVITDFREAYATLASKRFSPTHITWATPRIAWLGDTWFKFNSDDLPHGVYIEHKASAGRVHLTFPNTSIEQLRPIYDQLKKRDDMQPLQTSKSSSLEIRVPKIENFGNFSAQIPAIEKAFDAVAQLNDVWKGDMSVLSSYDRSGLRLASQTCLLLGTTKEGQRVDASVELTGKQIKVYVSSWIKNPNYDKELLEQQIIVGEKIFRAADDPIGWFEHLPYLYSGSYLRAALIRNAPPN